MSQNDGGEPVRLHKGEIPAPMIPRGVFKVTLDPTEPHPTATPGATLVLDQPIRDKAGNAYLATYHGATLVGFSEGELTVEVGPDVVVTWEKVDG